MLKHLRFRLTLLYLLVAMLLVAMLGGSTYSVLHFYFQNSTDQALKSKMASVLSSLGEEVPANFQLEDDIELNEKNEPDGDLDDDGEHETPHAGEIYEGELSSIFILPLSLDGEVLFNPNPYALPMQPDMAALDAALTGNVDYRSVTLDDGTPARLLTYVLPSKSGIDAIQAGKSVIDQVRILNQFLTSLLVIGGISIVILGLGSWWVAGRTLASHEKAWENQQAFIANASHELRTPLTLIRASSEAALRRAKKEERLGELLQDVISETDHMCNLVEDLLLLTRLDAGQLKLVYAEISLPELMDNIERQFSRLAREMSIHFEVNNVQGEIKSDNTRLRQILLILLDNAFHHTPRGGKVTLSVIREARNYRFTVEDTGEGIPSQHLTLVFDRFYQINDDRGGENHGSGLGLSIAKSLVEALGGHIEIHSEIAKGTTVTFGLPVGIEP